MGDIVEYIRRSAALGRQALGIAWLVSAFLPLAADEWSSLSTAGAGKSILSASLDSFRFTPVEDSPASETDREMRLRRFALGWAFPAISWGDGFLRFSLQYGHHRLNIQKELLPAYEDVPLHETMVGVRWVRPIPSDWSVLVSGSAGLAGDFRGVDAGSARFAGGVGVMYGGVSLLDIGVGAFYVNEYGKPRLVPVPLLVFKARSDRYYLRLNPPFNLDMGLRLKPRWNLGLAGRPTGGRFRLRDEGSLDDLKVTYSLFQFGPYVEAAAESGASIRLGLNVIARPRTRLENGDDEILYLRYKSALALGLAFRIPL